MNLSRTVLVAVIQGVANKSTSKFDHSMWIDEKLEKLMDEAFPMTDEGTLFFRAIRVHSTLFVCLCAFYFVLFICHLFHLVFSPHCVEKAQAGSSLCPTTLFTSIMKARRGLPVVCLRYFFRFYFSVHVCFFIHFSGRDKD
jgi:hypothetical protein